MAIILRLTAVCALLVGLVMTAPAVAAGEGLLEPIVVEVVPAAEDPLPPALDASGGVVAEVGQWAEAVAAQAGLITPETPLPEEVPEAEPPPEPVVEPDAGADLVADATTQVADTVDAVVEVADTVTDAATTTVTDTTTAVADAPAVAPPPTPTVAAPTVVAAPVPAPPAPAAPVTSVQPAIPATPTQAANQAETAAAPRQAPEIAPPQPSWQAPSSQVWATTIRAQAPSATRSPARATVRIQTAPALPASSAVAAEAMVELGVLRTSVPDAVDEFSAAPAVLTTGLTGAMAVPRITTTVSVAMDFARLSGGWAGPLVFNLWLRRQLRERRMSQRQLAAMSGVNHSTISRLLSGGRTPSLETAAKLVHALRLDWTEEQVATYFDLLPERTLFPTQRVESALRGDGDLDEGGVRELMDHYLAVRQRKRRLERARSEAAGGTPPPRSAAGPDGAT